MLPIRFERMTPKFSVWCSYQLSYRSRYRASEIRRFPQLFILTFVVAYVLIVSDIYNVEARPLGLGPRYHGFGGQAISYYR